MENKVCSGVCICKFLIKLPGLLMCSRKSFATITSYSPEDLDNMTYSKLGISDNKIITHLPIAGREQYLEYHRNEILKK